MIEIVAFRSPGSRVPAGQCDRELVVRPLSTQAPCRHAVGGQEVRGDVQKRATAVRATCATQKETHRCPCRRRSLLVQVVP
jgi:hypothetical protein